MPSHFWWPADSVVPNFLHQGQYRHGHLLVFTTKSCVDIRSLDKYAFRTRLSMISIASVLHTGVGRLSRCACGRALGIEKNRSDLALSPCSSWCDEESQEMIPNRLRRRRVQVLAPRSARHTRLQVVPHAIGYSRLASPWNIHGKPEYFPIQCQGPSDAWLTGRLNTCKWSKGQDGIRQVAVILQCNVCSAQTLTISKHWDALKAWRVSSTGCGFVDFRERPHKWHFSGGSYHQLQDLGDLEVPYFHTNSCACVASRLKGRSARMCPDSLPELSMPHTGSFQRSLQRLHPLRGITSVLAW